MMRTLMSITSFFLTAFNDTMTPQAPSSSAFNTDGGIHQIPLDSVTGQLWLCGKHHIAPDPEQVMQRHSLRRVVCLVQDIELRLRYDSYIDWLEEHRGTHAVWHPMHDLTYPDYDEVIDLVSDSVKLLRDGESLVVHCAAGIGRAGTTAVAICMMLGMSREDALKHVRMHRPMAGPEAGTQREFIDVLSRRLGR